MSKDFYKKLGIEIENIKFQGVNFGKIKDAKKLKKLFIGYDKNFNKYKYRHLGSDLLPVELDPKNKHKIEILNSEKLSEQKKNLSFSPKKYIYLDKFYIYSNHDMKTGAKLSGSTKTKRTAFAKFWKENAAEIGRKPKWSSYVKWYNEKRKQQGGHFGPEKAIQLIKAEMSKDDSEFKQGIEKKDDRVNDDEEIITKSGPIRVTIYTANESRAIPGDIYMMKQATIDTGDGKKSTVLSAASDDLEKKAYQSMSASEKLKTVSGIPKPKAPKGFENEIPHIHGMKKIRSSPLYDLRLTKDTEYVFGVMSASMRKRYEDTTRNIPKKEWYDLANEESEALRKFSVKVNKSFIGKMVILKTYPNESEFKVEVKVKEKGEIKPYNGNDVIVEITGSENPSSENTKKSEPVKKTNNFNLSTEPEFKKITKEDIKFFPENGTGRFVMYRASDLRSKNPEVDIKEHIKKLAKKFGFENYRVQSINPDKLKTRASAIFELKAQKDFEPYYHDTIVSPVQSASKIGLEKDDTQLCIHDDKIHDAYFSVTNKKQLKIKYHFPNKEGEKSKADNDLPKSNYKIYNVILNTKKGKVTIDKMSINGDKKSNSLKLEIEGKVKPFMIPTGKRSQNINVSQGINLVHKSLSSPDNFNLKVNQDLVKSIDFVLEDSTIETAVDLGLNESKRRVFPMHIRTIRRIIRNAILN